MLFPQPQCSAEINLATETLPPTSSEFGDIYVPEVLEGHHIQELMELLGGELEGDFYSTRSNYAALDELRLICRGAETFSEEHCHAEAYRRIIDIAQSRGPIEALGRATSSQGQFIVGELLIIRMGPGSYNHAHQHNREFTANILLQDNPRQEGETSGLFYTTYHSVDGPLPNDLGIDESWGQGEYGRLHQSEIGGMHARKAQVRHGVMPIPGEKVLRPEHPDPALCRYVLTYALPQAQF